MKPMDLEREEGAHALKIAGVLKESGHTAYFAGGCVRDHLMGLTPHDFDIATSALPDQVEKLFKRTVPVGKQFGVILVLEGDRQYEVATFRTESGYQDGRHPTRIDFTGPREDASRRDFTVNGLYYDPFAQKIIDYVGGEADIVKKVIRCIGSAEERFEEDKLRLLRAVRFASTLGFEIERPTWEAVKSSARKISCVSPERIREELVKMLTRPGAARGIRLLEESGLLQAVLPEISAMKDVAQPPDYHPEGDVFIHTMLLLEKLRNPSPTLALAALFHDVAKPPTYAVRNGKITFYEHAPLGARMTQEIMRRLRFSNDEIEKVSEAVENHMKFADVQHMREAKLRKFISRSNFGEELELHRIDCLSCHGNLANYQFVQEKIKAYGNEPLRPKPLLSGHDLISLGMKPGPGMKEVLEEAYELQLENVFAAREAALAWAEKRLSELPPSAATGPRSS